MKRIELWTGWLIFFFAVAIGALALFLLGSALNAFIEAEWATLPGYAFGFVICAAASLLAFKEACDDYSNSAALIITEEASSFYREIKHIVHF